MLPNQRAYTVPGRTILATIGLTLAAVVAVVFVMHVQRVLVWMLIAAAFTVVPPLAGDAGRVLRGRAA
jgi:hypothetical protein